MLCFRCFYLYIATLLLYRSLIGSGPMFAGPAAADRSVNVDNMMKGQYILIDTYGLPRIILIYGLLADDSLGRLTIFSSKYSGLKRERGCCC